MNRLLGGIIIASIFACIFAACTDTWEKTENGVIVHLEKGSLKTPRHIRLSVINENIIRVSATPDKFSKEKSLVVETPPLTAPWEAFEADGNLILQTSSLKAHTNLKTGEVKFTDLDNNIILQENKGGGKAFVPMEVDGTPGYTLHQVFESPDDEAFYGLGQHQADEFNYKGKNETLFQYNTKVSIPFLVSNKNYGILWDNYSLSKFGDIRDYAQLSQFKLYSIDGAEGGLTATYYTNSDPNNIYITRTENTIDYENLESIKDFPKGFPFHNSSIVWEGDLQAKESGIHRFLLYYAGYTKIWIDGKLMADRWRTAWNPSVAKFNVYMEAGKHHHIRLEWQPDGGVSYIGLKALSPVAAEEQNKLSLYSEMGDQIDYYFIKGTSMDDVIKGYRSISGKAQVMPKWAMGFWQSRERYKTQDELLNALKEFRKRRIPIDNIVLDWSYWEEDQWGSHQFDAKRFPNPRSMVKQVHDLNAKIMISVWPKFYENTIHYKEFDEKGWMYQRAVKDSIRDWIGKGYIGSFYDAYSEGARDLFWKQMKDCLYPLGFDAWWMDASEPDILSNASIEYRKELMNPTALGPSTKYFNTYALMNAMAIYNGQRAVDNDKRVFLLTRSGFCGLQKYGAVTWSGDIGTCWEDYKAQISAGLNHSMSGNPYWTMDIGGFCVQKRFEQAQEGSEDMNEWRELNARWTQFGAFVPLFRTHGQYPFREVYNIAPEEHPAYQTIVYYDKLRYRLMPYIYSMTGWVYLNDYTIMRPMVMDFGQDAKVNNIGNQYMFGPSLLVCPVYEYKARNREVYFPKNTGWYDFYNGTYTEGGQCISVDAPYERMPLFVKAGSIIPVGEEIQYSSEKPDADVTLYVYAGADASFDLYEDEGTNYNYEKGKYATISIQYNDHTKEVTIGERKGDFSGMVGQRKFHVVLVNKDKAKGFDTRPIPDATVIYSGNSETIKL
ncbi:alpha-D-xyloside xylohydrolase [Parabacteroides sp. PF5-5]|uniref:TIM-barrel domain-containing protein n=1 Tax=unclassified Parabacteroides TaxID=2649774 RepID=UPI002472E9C5|nr:MULTISPECIES: TIM-barrel domain-containing protein [unclassified Parabacteroides]MDH6304431.1 alpha-D-xyloside xylohydrolase [Parabacteroides sp. PH5-39]MDH6315416.1 alpha-D-xyloside xylohydrolase [Parabacteroides sp. PF5-13]MDH6319090.1 alpha-D-xyloside xylohydrolase [Parabacteroides sp. PH5-13]MDH6322820.1 alpha-D-xyloside xylohydrolase [Parabacteroides sp. PH5-8]MDH6326608.1 alpha-D-xyloside xylohydrolase [Parabacteroides sp. PH5-41]